MCLTNIGNTNHLYSYRYDGEPFCANLEQISESRRKRGKPPRKNRYDSYCSWAVCFLKKEVGVEGDNNPSYAFPEEVLGYIRDIVPGDVKGEIRDDAYKLTLAQFCESLDIPNL